MINKERKTAKKVKVQIMSTIGDADNVDAFKMFHDYVITKFGEQEQDLVIVASQFSKDTGCKLNLFLGGGYKLYAQMPEFKKWFDSYPDPQTDTGKKIKAKPGRATLISGANIVAAIKAKVPVEKQRPVLSEIPVVSRLELGEGLHFFGMFYPAVRKEKDFFGKDRSYSEVRFVKVERELEQRHANVELGPSFSEYAEKGEFVVGESLNGVPKLLDRSNRAIIFRSWSDFEESKEYDSLQAFLDSGKSLQLTPKFKTKYNEIVIFDECFLYTGFRMDMATRIMKADEIRVSVGRYQDLDAVRSIIYLFENRDDFQYGYGFAADKFMIGCPFRKRWQSTDAFFADETFWMEVDTRKIITLDEILKVCAEVLQDGEWHDRVDLMKELNERIPCLSASGVSDSAIHDGLRGFSNVELLDDEVGNWSAKIKNEDGGGVAWNKDEQLFFDGLKTFSKSCGYSYTDADLVRFHTSFKCSRMVILGGAPGVGKSSLVRLYAAYIGGKGDFPYLAVAVNPAWVEPADLLGSKDFAGEFQNPACGLAKFMRAAEGDGKNIYPVCFEEMNLACAEHYFSDFMQAVSAPLKYENEKEKNEYVVIEGYDEAGFKDKSSIPLKVMSNLRIVGTCNFDVTTHPFSPRFYDRCAYIELGADINGFPERLPALDLGKLAESNKESEKGSVLCLNEWLNDGGTINQDVTNEFKSLLTYLGKVDLLPSPRIAFQMKRYILSRPPFDKAFRNEQELQHVALDEALAHYDLAKYMPATSEELREMQTQLKGVLSKNKFSYSIRLIETIEKRFGGFSVS